MLPGLLPLLRRALTVQLIQTQAVSFHNTIFYSKYKAIVGVRDQVSGVSVCLPPLIPDLRPPTLLRFRQQFLCTYLSRCYNAGMRHACCVRARQCGLARGLLNGGDTYG